MPRQAPPTLNDRVIVERRRDLIAEIDEWEGDAETWDADDDTWENEIQIGDGAGNYDGNWVGVGPAVLRCEITQVVQGSAEAVYADKLTGSSWCIVEVRVSAFTRQITTDDRFRIPNTDRVLNVRHAPAPGRTNFIRFGCEEGVAT